MSHTALDSRPGRSRSKLRPSKILQGMLLDALAAKSENLLERDGLSLANANPEQTAKQPRLQPPQHQHPYAMFLRDFVDPIEPDPEHDPVRSSVYNWLLSVEEPIARNLTRSASAPASAPAPAMVLPRNNSNAGSFPTPPPGSGSLMPAESFRASAQKTSPVEQSEYRVDNLRLNGIHMRSSRDKLPAHIASLIHHHVRKDRPSSPGPSQQEVWADSELEVLEHGAMESQVEKYFSTNLFPTPISSDILACAVRQSMYRNVTPALKHNHFKISIPAPDLLYGYNYIAAFLQQQGQISLAGSSVNSQCLVYPFFDIEFKGDRGRMWVATNQCIGASVSCVNAVERLNRQLRQLQLDPVINSAAFSIAMDGLQAHLYVSWMDNNEEQEEHYYMQEFDCFLLQKPKHYLKLRKYVLNIIEWGTGERLQEIQTAVNTLIEAQRRGASLAAKARPHPTPDDDDDDDDESESDMDLDPDLDLNLRFRGRGRGRGRSRGRGRGHKRVRRSLSEAEIL